MLQQMLPEQMMMGQYYAIAALVAFSGLVLGIVAIFNNVDPDIRPSFPWIIMVRGREPLWAFILGCIGLGGIWIGLGMFAAPLVILAFYVVAILVAIAFFAILIILWLYFENQKRQEALVVAAPPPVLPGSVAEEIEVAKRHLMAGEYRSAVRDMGPSIGQAFEDSFDARLSPISPNKYIEMDQRFSKAASEGVLTTDEVSKAKRLWGLRNVSNHRMIVITQEEATEIVEEMEAIIKKLYGVA